MFPLKVVLEIEEDENVKSLQTDRQTDGRTDGWIDGRQVIRKAHLSFQLR